MTSAFTLRFFRDFKTPWSPSWPRVTPQRATRSRSMSWATSTCSSWEEATNTSRTSSSSSSSSMMSHLTSRISSLRFWDKLLLKISSKKLSVSWVSMSLMLTQRLQRDLLGASAASLLGCQGFPRMCRYSWRISIIWEFSMFPMRQWSCWKIFLESILTCTRSLCHFLVELSWIRLLRLMERQPLSGYLEDLETKLRMHHTSWKKIIEEEQDVGSNKL